MTVRPLSVAASIVTAALLVVFPGHAAGNLRLRATSLVGINPIAINDAGEICGNKSFGDSLRPESDQLVLYKDGLVIDLQGMPAGLTSVRSVAINGYGQIIGTGSRLTTDDQGQPAFAVRSFLWTPTMPNGTKGAAVEIDPASGADPAVVVTAINDNGSVVGWTSPSFDSADESRRSGFLWTPVSPNAGSGSFTDLGNLNGGGTTPYSINAAGSVVGASMTSAGRQPFLWTPGVPGGSTGSMAQLNLPRLPGFPRTQPSGAAMRINARGDIAMFAQVGRVFRPYFLPKAGPGVLFHAAGVPAGLTDDEVLLVSGQLYSGAGKPMRVSFAPSIKRKQSVFSTLNNRLQIVGYVRYTGTYLFEPESSPARSAL